MKTILSDFYDHAIRYRSMCKHQVLDSFMLRYSMSEAAANETRLRLFCSRFELDYDKLMSRTRKREYVDARNMLMLALMREKQLSSIKSASILKRDHATALRTKTVVDDLRSTDQDYNEMYRDVSTWVVNHW